MTPEEIRNFKQLEREVKRLTSENIKLRRRIARATNALTGRVEHRWKFKGVSYSSKLLKQC